MLHLKIKQVLQVKGIPHPQIWLCKYLSIGKTKAAAIEKDKLEYISLTDLSKLCDILHCTPNDLLYWQQTQRLQLPANHPCITQLQPPPNISQWQDIFKDLNATQSQQLMEKIKREAEQMKGNDY